MEVNALWDWADFGIMFRVSKGMKYSKYYAIVDIQIAWFNVWIILGFK